ncbi:hypothetical protein LOTGIDRAFT_163798 [Lottia gigantea]|uniref:Coronin n=1 Tax=Lottia gigantea TaxID=225164 RepID=V4A1P8_LOTGI|nr:hypothetical protein LOTGIDRAFT_163798 [Lottia gigantea]ESO90597.1 hypothetical protein LOTGIDRAFT_163798 [Lottia gigantea]
MAWRFKASKYKNAAVKFPKREELISELPVSSISQSLGNHIKASSKYIVFNTDIGKKTFLSLMLVHWKVKYSYFNYFVNDFDFSPFDDYLLATGSIDNTVKIWLLPEESGSSENLTSAEVTLPSQERKVENVLWHTTAEGLLAASTHKTVKVFDVKQSKEVYSLEHNDLIQSLSWSGNGQFLVTSCKDTKLRLFDPRSSTVAQLKRILQLHDARNIENILCSSFYDVSTSVLIPLYDNDTGMLFLAGKGDGRITYLEVNEQAPYLVENNVERTDQIKGVCLIPKRGVDVMQGEVNRLLVLAQNSIIPAPVIIPRKTYRDYHADLFPDTPTGHPSLTSEQWLQGENKELSLMSLDPYKRPKIESRRGEMFSDNPSMSSTPSSPISTSSNNTSVANSVNNTSKENTPDKQRSQRTGKNRIFLSSRWIKFGQGVRATKFRHLRSCILHRSEHIENIRHLDRTVPGESDFFHANRLRCVVPIEGGGGSVSVIELANKGKLPNTDVPMIQNGSKVTDYVFDPFDDSRLVVCCDDARIRVWRIPEGGLTENVEEPEMVLRGHTEKLYFAKFHPMAKDLLVTAAYHIKLKFWDLSDGSEVMEITDHPDQIFCCAWSPCGKYLATVCKDGQLRIYDPRNSLQAIRSGPSHQGTRGARCGWALNGKYIYTSGFSKSSVREIILYDSNDLSEKIANGTQDTSPSILIPFYDEDSSTVFLTGRGDRQIFAYEISTEHPHLFPLATSSFGTIHQALSYQTKDKCNVRDVEFATAWRLTKTTIEPIVFNIPRVKKEFFQDDLFPDTKVTWEPVLSCSDWLQGQDGHQRKISLKPDDMETLTSQPVLEKKPNKYESFNQDTYKSDDQKKEELLSAMTNKLELHDDPLPQDLTEGVDEDEWVRWYFYLYLKGSK